MKISLNITHSRKPLSFSLSPFLPFYVYVHIMLLFLYAGFKKIRACLWRWKHWANGSGFPGCSSWWRQSHGVSDRNNLNFYSENGLMFQSFNFRYVCLICLGLVDLQDHSQDINEQRGQKYANSLICY